jgi:triacylglycerol lipase
MSVWHPLWLPKLIIDAAEEQEALAAQRDVATSHSFPHTSDGTMSYPDMDLAPDRDPERGNDGLVTVSSAKWGDEFLGTMEGCDHWELRGARGLGADWDEGWGKEGRCLAVDEVNSNL